MSFLRRLLLVILVAALAAAAYDKFTGIKQLTIGHDTLYMIHRPWMLHVFNGSIAGIALWCLVFLRDAVFARIGLLAVLAAMGEIIYLSLHH